MLGKETAENWKKKDDDFGNGKGYEGVKIISEYTGVKPLVDGVSYLKEGTDVDGNEISGKEVAFDIVLDYVPVGKILKVVKTAGKPIVKTAKKVMVETTKKSVKVIKKIKEPAEKATKCVLKEVGCFVAGTQVATAKGFRNIEDISIGDSVYVYDKDVSNMGLRKVSNIRILDNESIYVLEFEHEKFNVGANQPFMVEGKWKAASALKKGDALQLQDGKKVRLKNIRLKKDRNVLGDVQMNR